MLAWDEMSILKETESTPYYRGAETGGELSMHRIVPGSKGRRLAWKAQRSKRGFEDPSARGSPRTANEKGSKDRNKMRMNVGAHRKELSCPKRSVPLARAKSLAEKLVWCLVFSCFVPSSNIGVMLPICVGLICLE